MADLQRRRGSALLPRLRLPSRVFMTEGEELDFSVATRTILELLVRQWALVDQVSLDPVSDVLQGFDAGDEPYYISHVVRIIAVKVTETEEILQRAADTIIMSNANAKDYHKALVKFLENQPSNPSAPSDIITRQQVVLLFGLCSLVIYQSLKNGRCDAFRHFLPWSTEFIADSSQVPLWIGNRGGWSRAFESKTPHCGAGTIGLIASFFVVATLLLVVHRRNGC